jgi:hypothetical protein
MAIVPRPWPVRWRSTTALVAGASGDDPRPLHFNRDFDPVAALGAGARGKPALIRSS